MAATDDRKKIELKSVFSIISEPMEAVLSTTSSTITHSGTKGDACEFQWLKWLKTYLPKRYTVDSGFVIDSEGYISDQQDIIIYDRQYTPYLLNEEGVIYVPAESVYAVIEVKQELNRSYIKYASDKIYSVRRLKRTSTEIHHAGGTYEAKPLHQIIGGLVCQKFSWSQKDLKNKHLINSLNSIKDLNQQIDLVCCLEIGSFFTTYEQNSVNLTTSKKEDAMSFFFIKLMSKLQNIATVPAIDFDEYGKFMV